MLLHYTVIATHSTKLTPHLQLVDINIKDANGRTAIEAMNDRITIDELFYKEFDEFWISLEMRSDTTS